MAKPAFYLGIDIGTSGVRAVVIDGAGRIQASSLVDMPAATQRSTSMTQAGLSSTITCVEQDAFVWWQSLTQTLTQLFHHIDPGQVAALAVDATSSTFLLTDDKGDPLHPALMYNDSRSLEEVEGIASVAPAENATANAYSSLAKCCHLYPKFKQARYAMHQADWITSRFTGRLGVSDEHNCLKLGYDPQLQRWPDWLSQLPIPQSLFPQVVPSKTLLGPVHPTLARQFKFSAETQVVAGTTDSTAAFIATGARLPGQAVTSLGSTMVLKVLSEQPVFSAQLGVYSHRLDHLWLVGGASNSGGAALLRYLSLAKMQTLTPLLQPQNPTGESFYPLPGIGERFPINDPGKLSQVTLPKSDDPNAEIVFFQALLEGIAQIEAQGYRLLSTMGAPYPEWVMSCGGGAQNPAWREIRAHILGVPTRVPEHTEAAYGSALLAQSALENQASTKTIG